MLYVIYMLFLCYYMLYVISICDALRDLVPFVQLKKQEKHPWRSVTFSKVAGFNLRGCVSCFFLKLYRC